ncbi:hypothetical protein PSPO01_16584 [Paraphaeosphaeria sporulosa]
MPGCRDLANSRRAAKRNRNAPLHRTKSTASCSLASACGLTSIYYYIHAVTRSDVSVPVFLTSNVIVSVLCREMCLFRCRCIEAS